MSLSNTSRQQLILKHGDISYWVIPLDAAIRQDTDLGKFAARGLSSWYDQWFGNSRLAEDALLGLQLDERIKIAVVRVEDSPWMVTHVIPGFLKPDYFNPKEMFFHLYLGTDSFYVHQHENMRAQFEYAFGPLLSSLGTAVINAPYHNPYVRVDSVEPEWPDFDSWLKDNSRGSKWGPLLKRKEIRWSFNQDRQQVVRTMQRLITRFGGDRARALSAKGADARESLLDLSAMVLNHAGGSQMFTVEGWDVEAEQPVCATFGIRRGTYDCEVLTALSFVSSQDPKYRKCALTIASDLFLVKHVMERNLNSELFGGSTVIEFLENVDGLGAYKDKFCRERQVGFILRPFPEKESEAVRRRLYPDTLVYDLCAPPQAKGSAPVDEDPTRGENA